MGASSTRAAAEDVAPALAAPARHGSGATFPVLTAARVVCRECLQVLGGQAAAHVERRVDAFLDCFSGAGALERALSCEFMRDPPQAVRALEYLAARGSQSFSAWATGLTVNRGLVHVLEWLNQAHPERCVWNADLMDQAAWRGALPVAKWLHENRSEGCTTQAMDRAAATGQLDMVAWLHVNRHEGCTTRAMDDAAAAGHLSVVQWLHANRSEGATTAAMDKAAAKGHLAVVQWLHDNRHEGCTVRAMNSAANYGHLELLQWLHANRTEGCSELAMESAARSGHLAVVQWLHANRTEGHAGRALQAAAWTGQVAVVQWLCRVRGQACRDDTYSRGALQHATMNGHVEVVRSLQTHEMKSICP